jgi:hypothetical protein
MNEYDDRDDRDYDDRPRRPGRRDYARSRVAFPAIILIVFGTIGLLLEITSLVYSFQNPTAAADMFRDWVEGMPPGPDKDRWTEVYKESADDMRMDTPINRGSYILGAVLSLLMIVGGVAMRSLGSYGLALTGAIAGIIPLAGCCCCATPVGIWAVIVLANPDVKAAFGRPPVQEDY